MEDDQQIDTFGFKWDNHKRKLIQKFYTFLQSGTLVDCTLKAEGKALKVHKVILSAYSPYFECLFRNHYDKHIILTLQNIKFKELKTIIDLMYRGKIHISRDELTTLLKVAKSLQIKGLSENITTDSTESRLQNTVSQSTATSLDIPHVSNLMIERNNVPRQTLEMSIGNLSEDSVSPQVSRGLSSREDSQNPTSRKRKRLRRRNLTEDSTVENQDASNSNDMPQQDMNDLNNMEQDNNQAGPSHDVTGAPGATGEVLPGAQEANDKSSWSNAELEKCRVGDRFVCDDCSHRFKEKRQLRYHKKHRCNKCKTQM